LSPLDIGGCATRIRHVLDPVEDHHQVESASSGNFLGSDLLEDETIGDSRGRRTRASRLSRSRHSSAISMDTAAEDDSSSPALDAASSALLPCSIAPSG
jgi:hypothetical protein